LSGSVTLPQTLTSVGERALEGCGVDEIVLNGSKTSLSSKAFDNFGRISPILSLSAKSYDAFSSQSAVNKIFSGAKILIRIPSDFDTVQRKYLEKSSNVSVFT
jgi:hypothetical protein